MKGKRIGILALTAALVFGQTAVSFGAKDQPKEDNSSSPQESVSQEENQDQKAEKPKRTPRKPFKVKALSLTTKKGTVSLSWKKTGDATHYQIFRKYMGGTFKRVKTTKKTHWTDKHVKTNCYVRYRVRGINKRFGQVAKGKYSEKKTIYAVDTDPSKKMIALTFDDGPGPYTDRLLKALKKGKARATFFVCGYRIGSYGSCLSKAEKIGCEIGNHSYDHPDLSTLGESGISYQISATDKLIKGKLSHNAALLRPPYGAISQTVRDTAGKPLILWSIDTLDWKTRSTQATINAVMNNAKDGDIVLMHDIHQPTVEAAVQLIGLLQKRGFQLVTVSELAKYKGYELKNGWSYGSFR